MAVNSALIIILSIRWMIKSVLVLLWLLLMPNIVPIRGETVEEERLRSILLDDIEFISRKKIILSTKNRLDKDAIQVEPFVLYEDVRKGLMPHGYRGDLNRFRRAFSYILEVDNGGAPVVVETNDSVAITEISTKRGELLPGRSLRGYGRESGDGWQNDEVSRFRNLAGKESKKKGASYTTSTTIKSIVEHSPKKATINPRAFKAKVPTKSPPPRQSPRRSPAITSRAKSGSNESSWQIAKRVDNSPGVDLSNAFKICVIGGSMTYGVHDGKKIIAWPSFFGELLNETTLFKDQVVHVINAARPGSPSATQVHELHDILLLCSQHGPPDLVMVDLTINDRTSHIDLGLGSNIDKWGATDECHLAGGGTMMDLLLDVLPDHIPLWYLETLSVHDWVNSVIHTPEEMDIHCTANSSKSDTFPIDVCSTYDVAKGFHWRELVRRGIPALSYGDVACPACSRAALANESTMMNFKRAYWDKYPHPSPQVHLFVARIVAMSLVAIIEESVFPPPKKEPRYQQEQAAVILWDDYIAKNNHERMSRNVSASVRQVKEGIKACALHPLAVLKGNGVHVDTFMPSNWDPGLSAWHYEMDYKDNYGWTGYNMTDVRSKAIHFPIEVSCNQHTVMIQALHSHHVAFGKAICTITEHGNHEKHPEPPEEFRINTRWHDRTTQLDTSLLRPKHWRHSNCSSSSMIQEESSVAAVLTCTVITGRVIFRRITSC